MGTHCLSYIAGVLSFHNNDELNDLSMYVLAGYIQFQGCYSLYLFKLTQECMYVWMVDDYVLLSFQLTVLW